MTKTWDTKNKILDMLQKRKMTLTDISKELDLAPSTVNQHLQELLQIGAIRQVENPFIIKWKYYEPMPGFRQIAVKRPAPLIHAGVLKYVSAAAIVAIIIAVLYGTLGSAPQQSAAPSIATPNGTVVQQALAPGAVPSGMTLFSVSDSPTVSSVEAVNVTVTGMWIHDAASGKWLVVFNGTKRFDLVQLNNISQVLSAANLSGGSYDQIRMYVSNVTAVINNQTVGVFVPSSMLRMYGNFNVSTGANSSSWINVDINLDRSLHITGNGKVVMLPVILVRTNADARLNVTKHGIVKAEAQGRTASEIDAAMNANGNMGVNGSAVPPGATLDVLQSGKIVVMGQEGARNTVAIHMPGRMIFVTNATNITNATGNIESDIWINGAGTAVAGVPERSFFSCEYSGTANLLSCTSTDNASGAFAQVLLNNSGKILIAGAGAGRRTMIDANITVNDGNVSGFDDIRTNASSAPVRFNVSEWGKRNVTPHSNLPVTFNASAAYCTSSSQCTLVPIAYCRNGLPQQSACVGSSGLPYYRNWYNGTVLAGGGALTANQETAVASSAPEAVRACPLFIVYDPIHCTCISNVCTEVVGRLGDGAQAGVQPVPVGVDTAQAANTSAGTVDAGAVDLGTG